jgi:hypothetical protein
VAAKDRERLAVSKQAPHVFDMEKLHLKKLKVKKSIGLNPKRFAALENLLLT